MLSVAVAAWRWMSSWLSSAAPCVGAVLRLQPLLTMYSGPPFRIIDKTLFISATSTRHTAYLTRGYIHVGPRLYVGLPVESIGTCIYYNYMEHGSNPQQRLPYSVPGTMVLMNIVIITTHAAPCTRRIERHTCLLVGACARRRAGDVR